MKYTLFFLLIGLLSACKGAKKIPAETTISQQPNTNAPMLITIKTDGCRGYCPMFKATFLNNGTVQYEGIRFVEKIGASLFSLTKEELAQLNKEVATTNLWQYPDRFPTTIADAPGATLTVYKGGETKNVYGSVERPKPIQALDKLLRSLLEAHGIAVKGVNPDALPEATRSEVIVKLKPELNAGNWIAEFKDLKLQLIRRVSNENIWVVGFDSAQITEQALIDRLKKTTGVLEAQTNQTIEERH